MDLSQIDFQVLAVKAIGELVDEAVSNIHLPDPSPLAVTRSVEQLARAAAVNALSVWLMLKLTGEFEAVKDAAGKEKH